MPSINNCPTPVRRTGGAAPKCVACSVSEDFCYRLATDTATVNRAGKHTYDIDENCVRTNEKWLGDDGAEIDRCTVPLTELLCGGGGGGGGSGVTPPTIETKDRELLTLCDPDTGNSILIQYDVLTAPPTLLGMTDLNTNSPYTGAITDLVNCASGSLTDCNPTISSAFGDALRTLLPGHSVAIQKPACCAVKVTTSAGNFMIASGMTGYSTADFNCPVTVTAIEILSGTCVAGDLIVTTQTKG